RTCHTTSSSCLIIARLCSLLSLFLFLFFFFLMIRRPPRSTLFPSHDALPISHTHTHTHTQTQISICVHTCLRETIHVHVNSMCVRGSMCVFDHVQVFLCVWS